MKYVITIIVFISLTLIGVYCFFSIKKSIIEIKQNLKKRKELKSKSVSNTEVQGKINNCKEKKVK